MGPCLSEPPFCFFETSFWNPVREKTFRLPAFDADADSITVSGFSGGAIVSVLMHVAYSETIKGAGISAGTAYGDSVVGPEWNVQKAVDLALANQAAGLIDDSANLKGAPVYMFTGTQDTVVNPTKQNVLHEFYEHFGANVIREFAPVRHKERDYQKDHFMEHFFANFTGGTKQWHRPVHRPEDHGVLRRFN